MAKLSERVADLEKIINLQDKNFRLFDEEVRLLQDTNDKLRDEIHELNMTMIKHGLWDKTDHLERPDNVVPFPIPRK